MHFERAVGEAGNLLQAGEHSSALVLGRERAHVNGLMFARGQLGCWILEDMPLDNVTRICTHGNSIASGKELWEHTGGGHATPTLLSAESLVQHKEAREALRFGGCDSLSGIGLFRNSIAEVAPAVTSARASR